MSTFFSPPLDLIEIFFSGGLSNYLYSCSLPDDVQLLGDEPRKVLLRYSSLYSSLITGNFPSRIYGESHQKHRGTLLIDSVVCTLLSERKLGPRIHGIFPEGRLEQFVEVISSLLPIEIIEFLFKAVSLLSSEIRDPKISQKIGRLLGEIHQLDMPLVKEPTWLYNTIERLVNLANSPLSHDQNIILDISPIFRMIFANSNWTKIEKSINKCNQSAISPKNLTI